jgi:hypothetical protein
MTIFGVDTRITSRTYRCVSLTRRNYYYIWRSINRGETREGEGGRRTCTIITTIILYEQSKPDIIYIYIYIYGKWQYNNLFGGRNLKSVVYTSCGSLEGSARRSEIQNEILTINLRQSYYIYMYITTAK